jgi:hypothetical protein
VVVRFLLRLTALALLSVAFVMAVLDATRSVAASALVFTPLADSWAWASPASMAALRSLLEQKLSPFLWSPVTTSLIALPGWLVFLLLAFACHALGSSPRPHDRRAA